MSLSDKEAEYLRINEKLNNLKGGNECCDRDTVLDEVIEALRKLRKEKENTLLGRPLHCQYIQTIEQMKGISDE